jgi:hypothetical protein
MDLANLRCSEFISRHSDPEDNMTTPGEVNQALGQAYQYVFIGALEASIKSFENKFDVRTAPEKTLFEGRDGKSFSFDFNGVLSEPMRYAEVFGESKGYSKGDNLLADFRTFIAKAYVTSCDHQRHRNDLFWFVTNVPFACSEGSRILFSSVLSDKGNASVRGIVGSGHIDDRLVVSLIDRVGVFILTDSYLRNATISYKVIPGDSLWTILKKLHGGVPRNFGVLAKSIAYANRLRSPDEIVSGRRIRLRWIGPA